MKRILTMIIGMVLILSMITACGKSDTAETTDTTETTEAGNTSVSSVVMDINGVKVSTGEAIFILRELERMYESQYGADIWEGGYEGETFDDIVKEAAIDSLTRIRMSEIIANDHGVELTDEGVALIDEQLASYLETYPIETLEEDGITEEDIKSIFLGNALAEKLMEVEMVDFVVDEDALAVSLEADTTYQNIQEYGYEGVLEKTKVQHILLSFENEDGTIKTEEEKAEVLVLAEEVLAKVNAGEDFEALVETYSGDPGKVDNKGIYEFYRGEMVPEFEEAALALDIGEVSDLVLSDYGYHIIEKLDMVPPSEEEVASVKEYEAYIIENYKTSQKQVEFETLFSEWELDYEVVVDEDIWATILTSNQKSKSE